MEIINTYDETIAHYSMKLNHAEDELNLALKGLQELEFLAGDSWKGTAGSAVINKLLEIRNEAVAPRRDMEQIRSSLTQLSVVIEEEIRSLEAEMAAAAAAAASMGM